jgi:prepilin-type N-terminal cleavage/methylation domain-containing protein
MHLETRGTAAPLITPVFLRAQTHMKSLHPSARKQRGFTLVEMSITMAVAGLLFAAVATGQELIDQAKSQKLYTDLKAVEAQIQQYATFKRRLPGDCNRDGLIDYVADATSRLDVDNTARSQEYSYSSLIATIPADGAEATDEENGCAIDGATATAPAVSDTDTSDTNANVWINDLKLAGVISDSVTNRVFAKTVNEDFMFVGKVVDAGATSALGAEYNAIVLHNVPQWMALRLATAVNGQDAKADRSRLRQLNRASTDGTYEKTWQVAEDDAAVSSSPAMRDAMVTVAYFFDRVPESQQ